MLITDDPIYDFEMYDRERQEYISSLPVCKECWEPVNYDDCYSLFGRTICRQCLEAHEDDPED